MMGWIYTGISWILLKWHAFWHAIGVGDWLGTNWDWILAIVFLVLTIRVILFPVFVKQIKSQRAMQALQPQIAKLREQYKNDRQGLQRAQMELMKEENANPLMGCLPLVVQIPVFIGLFHVLRHLKPTMSIHGQQLYGWSTDQFESAANAKLFGAPISAAFRSSKVDIVSLGSTQANVWLVTALLVVIMIVTTFLTQYQMIKKTGWSTDQNQRMIQKLMLYGVPAGLLFSGTFFPIGVVIYWVTTNVFTLGQQQYVLRKFPPPVNVDTSIGVGKLFGHKKAEEAQGGAGQRGAGQRSQGQRGPAQRGPAQGKPGPANAGARNVKGGKPVTNGAPVAKPTVAPPKVGAKPTNPKKGNAAKRLSS
ncbi:MAG TPA: membrane protein insertase YidC [Micromonosporaceae bacterium]|nr:membrane protein insertase YidC [Micromonosporaceae bacterium]